MITDLTYLESLSNDDENFIKEMIGIFKEQIDEYAVGLTDLLAKSDFINLSKLAHKAKSSVAVMGMKADAELLKKLEIQAQTGEGADQYAGIIEKVLANARLAVKELEKAYP